MVFKLAGKAFQKKPYKQVPRASALVITIGAIFGITVIIISLFEWSNVEEKVSEQSQEYSLAVYNTTSLLELGLSQVSERLAETPSLNADEFLSNPLEVPPLNSNFFATSESSEVVSAELVGGMIPPPTDIYIDPNDPANINDPDKGDTVSSREVMLLARVEQQGNFIAPTAAYSSVIFEIRDKPFFTAAVFSDGDLVVLRPPAMSFSGPVHTNGDLVLVSGTGKVYFNGIVTAAGDISTPSTYSNDMNFRSGGTDSSPTYMNYVIYSGSDWKTYAENRWQGFLQTKDMGIVRREPFGFETLGGAADANPYHKIIEAAQLASSPGVNPQAESEKFSGKAGVVITVNITKTNPSYNDGEEAPLPPKSTLEAISPPNYSPPVNQDINAYTAVERYIDNLAQDKNTVTVRAYKMVESGSGSYYGKGGDGSIQRFDRVEITGSILNFYNASYPADPNSIIRTQGPSGLTYQQLYDYYTYYYANRPSYLPSTAQSYANAYKYNGSDPGYGVLRHPWLESEIEFKPSGLGTTAINWPIKMWDARRRKWIHLVDLDIGKLKTAVESGSVDGWNGILYIEFNDLDRTGLRLVNATQIPNVNDEGMTLATNNALYILGHYNADGNLATGSSTAPDSASEPPAAIAADAVTVLSNYWDDRKSRTDVTRFTYTQDQNDRNVPQDTEISAAIIAGMDIYQSGGINNFIRFLEMWSGHTVRIRGSLVSLFTSEAAWEPWDVQYVYYPPFREYGFHEHFKNNRFPPGTPIIRSFMKKQRRDIFEGEYNELKSWITQSVSSGSSFEDYRDGVAEIQRQYNLRVGSELGAAAQ